MASKLNISVSDEQSDEISSDELHLSCSSSDFSADDEHEPQTAIEPYMFEPQASSESSDTTTSDEEGADEERLLNTEWCSCSNCTVMATVKESVCCQELDKMQEKISIVQPEVSCICAHPGFASVCLDVWVLDTAYYQYRQQYKERITDTNKYRYTAYRQLARFVWGYLGKTIRVVLPSCAVNAIRKEFPSADNTYTGYLEPEVL